MGQVADPWSNSCAILGVQINPPVHWHIIPPRTGFHVCIELMNVRCDIKLAVFFKVFRFNKLIKKMGGRVLLDLKCKLFCFDANNLGPKKFHFLHQWKPCTQQTHHLNVISIMFTAQWVPFCLSWKLIFSTLSMHTSFQDEERDDDLRLCFASRVVKACPSKIQSFLPFLLPGN